jgi:hypothetical protein
MFMRALTLSTAFAVMVALAPAARAQDDPYTGTWVLNLAKSGGDKRTQVLTIKVVGDEETYQSDMMSAAGRRQVTNYTAKYDGKEYPSVTVVTEPQGTPTRTNNTIMLKKISERVRERRSKQGDRVTIRRRTVSEDGKVMTSQSIVVDASSRETPGTTLVFDKK